MLTEDCGLPTEGPEGSRVDNDQVTASPGLGRMEKWDYFNGFFQKSGLYILVPSESMTGSGN
jgi:hypothetical protein